MRPSPVVEDEPEFAIRTGDVCLTEEDTESVRRACDYLVKMQREDGGWGESWKVGSCVCLFLAHLIDCNLPGMRDG